VHKAVSHPQKIKFLTNCAENIREYIQGVQLLIKEIGHLFKRQVDRIPRISASKNDPRLNKCGILMGALYRMDSDNTTIDDLKVWLEEFENRALKGEVYAIGVITNTIRIAHVVLIEKEPNFLQHYKDVILTLRASAKDKNNLSDEVRVKCFLKYLKSCLEKNMIFASQF
jgi:hypothetical protein